MSGAPRAKESGVKVGERAVLKYTLIEVFNVIEALKSS